MAVDAEQEARLTSLAVDIDVLGDTRRLWRDWLEDAARVLEIDVAALPDDRVEASAALDRAGAGNWRALLGRFAEDRAPVYLRPNADATAALRTLAAAGARVALFTDAPDELAAVAAAHLGATRRVETVEAGKGALDRLAASMGPGLRVISTREELLDASTGVHADP